MKKIVSFTLIELLIVIVIIGILAVALIPRLTGIQGAARDNQRMADLKQIQTALEFYASENNGNYPTTAGIWWGNCQAYGNHPLQGSTGYIPNPAPAYLNELPTDPKPTYNQCYLYKSNGSEYMVLVHKTVEGKVIPEFKRLNPIFPNDKSFAVYTSGAKYW